MWDFRIAFDVPRGWLISIKDEPRTLDGHQITLRALNGYGEVLPGQPEHRHGGRMLLAGTGYQTESEAMEAVVRAAMGLLKASLHHGFGISFKPEAWSQYAVEALISKFKSEAPKSVVLIDTLGAEVFSHQSFRHEISATQVPLPLPIEAWLQEFQEIYASEIDLSTMAVPLIILNEAQAERSITSRLLLSVTAIEAIAGKRKERSPEEIGVIKQLSDLVKRSDLNKDQKDSLRSAIGDMKRNSISKTCQALVRESLCEESVLKFKEIYDIRSKLVHEGANYPVHVLHEKANEALQIAKALIDNARINDVDSNLG